MEKELTYEDKSPPLDPPKNDIFNRKELINFLNLRSLEGSLGSFIQLVATVSTYDSHSHFEESLKKGGFKFCEKYGNLYWYETKTKDQNTHEIKTIPYYFFLDEEKNIQLFLTRAKKTEEMPQTLLSYINKTRDISNLWIAPSIMHDLKNKLDNKFTDEFQLSYFTANRNSNSQIPAERRPAFERTIQYYGADAKSTLNEMEYLYGVYPKIMEIRIGHSTKFRIDDKGIITLREGDVRPVFDTLDLVIQKVKNVSTEVLNSSYRKEKIGKVERWVQHPWVINIPNGIKANLASSLVTEMKNEEWNFIPLIPYINNEQPYFSSRIIDGLKSASFDVELTKNCASVYPVDKMDIGTALRFYQFICYNQDFEATVGIA